MTFVADKETLGKVKNLGLGGDMSSFPPSICIRVVYRGNFLPQIRPQGPLPHLYVSFRITQQVYAT